MVFFFSFGDVAVLPLNFTLHSALHCSTQMKRSGSLELSYRQRYHDFNLRQCNHYQLRHRSPEQFHLQPYRTVVIHAHSVSEREFSISETSSLEVPSAPCPLFMLHPPWDEADASIARLGSWASLLSPVSMGLTIASARIINARCLKHDVERELFFCSMLR